MNLELYRIFYVVAEMKNITKASEILNISQPAVTKHIKNLEDQLGTPLFIRTKKGVVLNEYGKKIFLNVKQALTLLDESEKEIGKYKSMDKGTIKIGISTTLTKKYLLKYLEKFHTKYPNIIVDIYTDPTKELINKLKNGNIDLIISKLNISKIAFVITDCGEEISKTLVSTSPRGVTLIDVKGVYTNTDKMMLFCALKESETEEFQKKILAIDKTAFIVFSESQRIKGNGFYLYK